MSEILFGQSYYLRFDPKLWEAMRPYPPLGTLYAASYLRSKGYDVALFDAMLATSEVEWSQALNREKPRLAVIYEDNFNYLSKMCLSRMRQAAFTMIEMAKTRNCIVIVCGSDAADHAADYLERGADFVLMGEGEYTLGELVASLTGQHDLQSCTQPATIPGLAFCTPQVIDDACGGQSQSEASTLIRTPRRPDIRELDALPFPAWDLVDIPRYQEIWQRRHGYYSMNMVTTRGCPFHCNWCAKPIWGQRYNVRSPENVVAEMQWLKQSYQPDHIWFADDIMGLKPGWLQRFASLVEAQGACIPFKCLSRVDLLQRPGDIAALQRAGCEIVWVGAESGSQKILDSMDKGTRVEQIYLAAQRLQAAGIQVGFFLQFGYPGETQADIEKTLQMVRDCQPDDIGMSVSYALPGTKFYKAVKEQLGAKQNWVDSNDLEMLYRGPYASVFYRKLHTVLHKEFRARKTWQSLRSWGDSGRKEKLTLRQVGAMTYYLATLPLARWQLRRLAAEHTQQAPHQRLDPLPPIMAPEAAAQPSAQPE
ncbi:MAG: B12-binding domain-containing radical SAM protein [Chloroflexi bacterium]|nr:B12-binding domain-containing radical SAM protein [Chloroflexota bacterium]